MREIVTERRNLLLGGKIDNPLLILRFSADHAEGT